MTSAAYSYKPRLGDHVSLTKLSMILANLGLWAGLIVSLAVIAR